jgi:small subunit ribosomal protein S1
VKNVEDEVAVGQSVQVRIINVNTTSGKLDLSMRQNPKSNTLPYPEPANLSVFKDISSDKWLPGKVANILPFGAVVTVSEPSSKATADGLLHIAQISNNFVKDVADEVKIGQSVKVRIVTVDSQIGRFDLSMKDGSSGKDSTIHVPADIAAFEGIPQDKWLTGKVARITAFGAFITVIAPSGQATAEGLLHISEIREDFLSDVADAVEVGQIVKVRIINLNVNQDRMWLSMKETVDSSAPAARTLADFTAS